jgi:hypothetical protein
VDNHPQHSRPCRLAIVQEAAHRSRLTARVSDTVGASDILPARILVNGSFSGADASSLVYKGEQMLSIC